MKSAAELPPSEPQESLSSRCRVRILPVVDVEPFGDLGEAGASSLNLLALNRRFDAPHHTHPALCVGRKVVGDVQVSARLEQDDVQAAFCQLLDCPRTRGSGADNDGVIR